MEEEGVTGVQTGDQVEGEHGEEGVDGPGEIVGVEVEVDEGAEEGGVKVAF